MKIIKIKTCLECPFVYPHPMPLQDKDVNICGHDKIMNEIPGWNDRVVKKTRFPDFCPLEDKKNETANRKKT